ncbi:hypothetical protein ACJJTC_004704 [Scirpophaga incertulas]
MAVFVTKCMLSKFNNKIEYPSCNIFKEDELYTSEPSWPSIADICKTNGSLAKSLICRICARNGAISIKEKVNCFDIMTAICSITNVTITTADSLPKYICNDCLEMLRVAVDFKIKCEEGDRRFRRLLQPMGDPSFSSYPYSKHDFQSILNKMKRKKQKLLMERELIRQKKHEQRQEKLIGKVKQFKCSSCDLTFPNKEQLVAHQRERQCMRRACDICGQLVLSIGQHKRHIHKQKILHKCTTCGKEFPIIARLKNHMLVHMNTFNYFCDLCPYKCKHKYYLVMHMRTHTGEKPYKCAQCQATFVNPSNLNKHKLTHQEKQFKCTLCDKAFRTNTALRDHHDVTHMNIKHTCVYCGRDFCYKSDLRKHEIRNHNRLKREYKGAEPTYKQVERLAMAKAHDDVDPMDKWRTEEIILQPPPPAQATFIDQGKEFLQAGQTYFTDVNGMIHQPPIVQQTVEISFPDIGMKKDDVKIYEAQQAIGYF